ncbi:hypothetical protein DFH11DRAFT_1219370 [Phellopilus nigrolimitatus]|nr:hypothetical protein DFH11DRAFT_1219370 [Phellopilus nigrolimitatus]
MEDRPFEEDHAIWTVALLRSFARQGSTADDDLSYIKWDHVWDSYPHSVLRTLFARLFSTPNVIFYRILHEQMGDKDSLSVLPWVVQSEKLRRLSQKLAFFTDSEDQLLSSRARNCVTSLLVIDFYCRAAILRALSTTRYGRTPEFAQLAESQQVRNIRRIGTLVLMFYRHCDANGKLIHIYNYDFSCDRDCTGKGNYDLKLDADVLLQLRVQRGEAFSSVGHYPIVAGRTVNGELAYVAEAFFGLYGKRFCAVTEGMKPENLRLAVSDSDSKTHRMRVPKSFSVYVLRYEPSAYARNGDLDVYGSEGLDSTGPFAWRPLAWRQKA